MRPTLYTLVLLQDLHHCIIASPIMKCRLSVWTLLLAVTVLVTATPLARSRQLRSRADLEGPDGVSEGAKQEGNKMSGQKELLAKTLLSIADQIQGKSKGGRGSGASDPEQNAFSDAVLKAVKVLGKKENRKVALDQVAATSKMGQDGVGKSKATVAQLVEALRLPSLKPKKPTVDKKKLLSTAVSAVEAKLDQLSDMLADSKQENMEKTAEKTAEEEASLDMQHGLNSAPPLPAPINFRLDMEKPELPDAQ